MPKQSLQDSFKEFCKQNKFEVNKKQIEIINSLDKFLNQKRTLLGKLLKRKKNYVFTSLEK